MIRKVLKKTSKHEKLREFIHKYNVPKHYLATNRKMISRGVFLGLFIAAIPMPMQMAAVLLFMPIFRFNVPVALAMCWLSNPFTMPAMYYAEYITGSFILGTKVGHVEMTLDWFSANMDKIFIPLYTGTLVFSIVASTLGYLLVNFIWKSSVYKDRSLHYSKR